MIFPHYSSSLVLSVCRTFRITRLGFLASISPVVLSPLHEGLCVINVITESWVRWSFILLDLFISYFCIRPKRWSLELGTLMCRVGSTAAVCSRSLRCVSVCLCVCVLCGGQRTTCGSWLCPSTLWIEPNPGCQTWWRSLYLLCHIAGPLFLFLSIYLNSGVEYLCPRRY